MPNGINDREKLEFALQPSEITFRSQAAWWLSELGTGRLKSRQKKYLAPSWGHERIQEERPLTEI